MASSTGYVLLTIKQLDVTLNRGRAIVQAVSRRRPGFEPGSDHVGFVVDHVFSEYFGFPCQFAFHRLLHNHHLSSRAGTIGQLVTDVPRGLSLIPREKNTLNSTSIVAISQIHTAS
jgi:hypothetical protein